MTAPATPRSPDSAEPVRRRGTLALVLQEALTATARLRANRQVASDAESFRAHIKRLLAAADEEARRAGYPSADARMAIYAVTVFVDESVLNSSQPMFADWPRKPLQEEVFGGHMGGEMFFKNLRELLAREDSEDLADLLEVHQLCMLLGFRGRYSLGDTGELRSLMAATADKIGRVRGGPGPLSPNWAPPSNESVSVARDPWLNRLVYTAGALTGLALFLFLLFAILLRSGTSELHQLTRQLIQ